MFRSDKKPDSSSPPQLVHAGRAIYGHDAMLQYAMAPVAPIRVIVRNGDVTLEGVVASEMARNIAGIQANSITGVFSVKNNLKVARL